MFCVSVSLLFIFGLYFCCEKMRRERAYGIVDQDRSWAVRAGSAAATGNGSNAGDGDSEECGDGCELHVCGC